MIILAGRYGHDPGEAAITGLLHDCAKGIPPPRIQEIMEEQGYCLEQEVLAYPKLWHARWGAIMAGTMFGIKSKKISEAIRVHPTGAPNMSDLGKLLFIADYIEPTRRFKGVNRFRELAFKDKEEAFKAILEKKIEHVIKKGKPLHQDSLSARKFYFQEDE